MRVEKHETAQSQTMTRNQSANQLDKAGRFVMAPLSPIGLATISFAFFLVAVLTPPGVYERLMNEPDLMFLNPTVVAFYFVCSSFFVLGVLIYGALFNVSRAPKEAAALTRAQIAFPLFVAAGLNVLSFALLLKSNPWLLTRWLANSEAVKSDLKTAGAFTATLPSFFAVIWWSQWRLRDREVNAGRRDWALRALVVCSLLFASLTALTQAARYELLPGVGAFLLVGILHRFHLSRLHFRYFIKRLLQTVVLLLAVFLGGSYLRGSSTVSKQIDTITGYSIASYNRLAAVLSGDLVETYGGTGIYALRGLFELPLLHRWINVGGLSGISPREVLLSEFPAVREAGLQEGYIWTSAFGYVYSDIGIGVFPYAIAIGMVAGWAWGALNRRRTSGIVFYPWIAMTILLWFGDNFFAYRDSITSIGVAALLYAYERLIGLQRPNKRREPWTGSAEPHASVHVSTSALPPSALQ